MKQPSKRRRVVGSKQIHQRRQTGSTQSANWSGRRRAVVDAVTTKFDLPARQLVNGAKSAGPRPHRRPAVSDVPLDRQIDR